MVYAIDHTGKRKIMKRIISFISFILAAVISFGALGAVGVAAEGTGYTVRNVDAYVYTLDSTTEIECVFYDVLPEVPFVDPADYLSVIFTDEFTEEKGADGRYTVTNVYGVTMVIDTEADTVYFGNYDDFISCEINYDGSSVEINFVDYLSYEYTVETAPVTLYFADYGMDIIEEDGKVFLPLVTLGAMFSITYNNALYFDGKICFVHTFDPESYYDTFDLSPLYERMTRSAQMAEFTYGTLCFTFDYFYGNQSNSPLSALLDEMSLDAALDVYDDVTPEAKQLLKSEDMVDYMLGLTLLSYYTFDGGHTVLLSVPLIGANYYSYTPLVDGWYDRMYDGSELSDIALGYMDSVYDVFDFTYKLNNVRYEEYKKYENEIAKEFESGAYLIVHGKTAVFVFDSFDIDTPYELKECLDYAAECGVETIILDDSCNGGGYVAAYQYIMTLITNATYHTNECVTSSINPLTGSILESVTVLDLNLDGVFDDADRDFMYDFDFAILTSHGAYSCGNELPVFSGALGVMILGETSGGGSCNVTERYLADGFSFTIADIDKSYLEGADVDLGASVDAYLVTTDGNGEPDYRGFYDIDKLAQLVKAFYHPAEPGDLNGDGELSMKDVLMMRRYIAGLDTLTDAQIAAGDLNGDGDIDMKDVLKARRIIAGLD